MLNTYLIIQSNDDTILLEKWNIDFTNYTIVNLPNGDIQLYKIKEIIINNIDELINYNLINIII